MFKTVEVTGFIANCLPSNPPDQPPKWVIELLLQLKIVLETWFICGRSWYQIQTENTQNGSSCNDDWSVTKTDIRESPGINFYLLAIAPTYSCPGVQTYPGVDRLETSCCSLLVLNILIVSQTKILTPFQLRWKATYQLQSKLKSLFTLLTIWSNYPDAWDNSVSAGAGQMSILTNQHAQLILQL